MATHTIQEVKITNLALNPGILPFRMGDAKLRASSHTFIHYFDLKPIEDELSKIIRQYQKLEQEIKDKINETFMNELQNQKNLVKFQIYLVQEKFNSLHFNKRVKRGFFDGLGSVFKTITGNLDASDGKRYDEAIHNLHSNEINLATTLDKQISLTTKILDEYNTTLTLIKQNEELIGAKLIDFEKNGQNTFISYVVTKNALDEINSVVNIILHTLNNLENGITFARLKIFHSSILKIEDLKFIIEKLLLHYTVQELFFGYDISNIHKYYEIIDVESYHSKNRIVFIIHFPIMYRETYSYYHLFPVPNKNNTILIPTKPYLIISNKGHQYADEECRNIHPMYYCMQKDSFELSNQNDCLNEILQLQNSNSNVCQPIPVVINQEMIQEITTSHYITIFPKETKLKLTCRKTDLTTLQGSFLIELPTNCSFQTPTNLYINNEETIIGQPLLLPSIKIFKAPLNKDQQLDLHHISLDQVHKLQKDQQLIRRTILKNIPNLNHTWIIPACSFLLLLVIFGTICLYKQKWCKKTSLTEKNHFQYPTQDEDE